MDYVQVVKEAQEERKKLYGYGKVKYVPCEIWLKGDQINLWTYWQGFQLKDIDEKGVDIMLVGQDWGNPERNKDVIQRIKEIRDGSKTAVYLATKSPTDRLVTEMFKVFGVDVTKRDPGIRLFFTNYSLGYRDESETGGMTKALMKQDKEHFDKLVLAIKPKIIICLGKITYEMVSGEVTKGFVKALKEGNPFKASFPLDSSIPVYGVAHCGTRGLSNMGGTENMKKAWFKIAEEYRKMES